MFRRRTKPDANPPKSDAPARATTVSSNGFNPATARPALFDALSARIGPEYADLMEQDFQAHIDSDPINGAEQAYFCLAGKMIDYIDLLNGNPPDLTTGSVLDNAGADRPVSGFTVYRKEG